jgi:hypothetical protein
MTETSYEVITLCRYLFHLMRWLDAGPDRDFRMRRKDGQWRVLLLEDWQVTSKNAWRGSDPQLGLAIRAALKSQEGRML